MMFNNLIDTSREQQVYVKIQNFDYLKNNEYYSPIADGYTMFGFLLNPQVGYQVSKYLGIEAGAFMSKDFGNDKFNDVLPTFSLRYVKKDFKMIFGNLDGSINHRLIEPMYNFERAITNRLESGLQFVLNKPLFDFDLWADWQKMIYRESSDAEKVWGGLSGNTLKLKRGKSTFKIPFQLTVLHSGGQIDTSIKSMTTRWNANAGVALTYTPGHGKIDELFLDGRYAGNVHYVFTPAQSQNVGFGYFINTGLRAHNAEFLLTYWYGYNYASDYGGYLYNSLSSAVHYAGTYKVERSLLFLRITKKIRLADHVYLTLRAEPYYDLGLNFFEYSYGFYITLDEQVWLKKK